MSNFVHFNDPEYNGEIVVSNPILRTARLKTPDKDGYKQNFEVEAHNQKWKWNGCRVASQPWTIERIPMNAEQWSFWYSIDDGGTLTIDRDAVPIVLHHIGVFTMHTLRVKPIKAGVVEHVDEADDWDKIAEKPYPDMSLVTRLLVDIDNGRFAPLEGDLSTCNWSQDLCGHLAKIEEHTQAKIVMDNLGTYLDACQLPSTKTG